MTFASIEQLKAISLTCVSIFCAVSGYKLYLLKNFEEQLDMFPQETIDKFLQLAEQGCHLELRQFLLDFNQQSIVASFSRLLTTNDMSLNNFLRQHGLQALHIANIQGHGEVVLHLLESLTTKVADLKLNLDDFIKLFSYAITRHTKGEIDYLCNLVFSAENSEDLLGSIYTALPQILSLEFLYQDRITTVLIRIFRCQMHYLAIMLSKSVDVEQLQKKDVRGHSALSSAINYFMEEAASIILQRISGNGSPPLSIDSFKEWRFLGQGGFAEVYTAYGTDKKLVALKKAKKKEHLYFYIKEMRILKELDSVGIIKCNGAFVSSQDIYLVLEYIDGMNLFAFHKRVLVNKKTPEHHYRMVGEIAARMQEILCYLYLMQTIHLDIKSENVMIEYRGEEIKLTLIDFALSVNADDNNQAIIKGLVGTEGCMAPEIVKVENGSRYGKAHVSGKSDVFSNGIMIFELLSRVAGMYLFYRKFPEQTHYATLNLEHKWPPSLMLPQYGNLREHVDMSLNKDPKERPQAAELPSPLVVGLGI